MKVKIGKYTPWWSTHYTEISYLQWKYGAKYYKLAETDYTLLDKIVVGFLDAWQVVLNHTVNPIFNRMERKIKVRIYSHDVWNMDSTLAYVVVPMLKRIKEEKQGAPNVEPEDVPEELRPTPAEIEAAKVNGDTDEKWFDRWDWVLDEMIFAFERCCDDEWENEFYSGEINFDYIMDQEDNVWRTDPKDTFKVDYEGMDAVNARIDNGLRLFGKYYRCLWT